MSGDIAAALEAVLASAPVVAILRGLTPDQAIAVGEALFDAGVRVAEVPLNSPSPFESIALLRAHFGERMIVGAGTVLDPADALRLADAGGQICVAPDCNPAVIAKALERGIVPMPGVASPSEAFRAYDAGARWLKYFPAGDAGLSAIGALRPVMPPGVRFVAVGGVGAANAASFIAGGCSAIGVGSELFRPGRTAADVGAAAHAIMAAATAPASPALIANPSATISESPLLSRDGTSLFFVDPVQSKLHRIALSDGAIASVATAVPVNAIGWRGEAMIGLGDDALVELDPATGDVTPLVQVEVGSGCRFNDMTIASDGTVWAGTMHRGLLAGRGALFRIDAARTVTRACDGLGACNGMALTADERSLYLVDTLLRTLIRFPVAEDRTLGEPVIVSDFMGLDGKPDGMTLAPNGHSLVAMWGGSEVVELGPDGALQNRYRLPAPHVSSLCIGTGGDVLVTTSRMRLSTPVAGATTSGGVFKITRR